MKAIPLTRDQVALVDDADYDRVVAAGPWYAHKTRRVTYAVHSRWVAGKRESVLMHRLVLGALAGQEIDHVNGNGLDNCRVNLRFATNEQNQANSPKRTRPASSRFKGVYLHRQCGRWMVRIDREFVGEFELEEEAARAYDEAAAARWGTFARLNFGVDHAVES